jgi:type I restriction enzyme S subunit
MREGWIYKKLNEVCDKGSSNITINKLIDCNGDYPLFGASGLVKNVNFFHQDRPYIGIVKDGAGVGRVNTYPAFSSLVGTMQYIFAKENCLLDYIKYFLVKLDLSHCVSGATIPHIYFKDYGKEKIPVPSIEIQQSIVAELDMINELIELKKMQLSYLDNLVQSLFYEMFGDPLRNEKEWEVKKLGEMCTDIKYGTSKPACDNGQYKYLRMCNLTYNGYLDLTDLKTINISNDEIEKCIVRKGDILFNRTNSIELIGKTCMFDEDEPMVIAGYIIRVRLNEAILPVYLARAFNLPSIKKYLRIIAKGAVNQANINSKELASIPVPLPPLSLQQSFAARVNAIEEQKLRINTSIKDLETLFASRMQYWFE